MSPRLKVMYQVNNINVFISIGAESNIPDVIRSVSGRIEDLTGDFYDQVNIFIGYYRYMD